MALTTASLVSKFAELQVLSLFFGGGVCGWVYVKSAHDQTIRAERAQSVQRGAFFPSYLKWYKPSLGGWKRYHDVFCLMGTVWWAGGWMREW